MMEKLIIFFGDTYINLKNQGKDPFQVLCSKIARNELFFLYRKLAGNEFEVIENIAQDEKQKFWDIAMKYEKTKVRRIQAAKAAYMLTILTNV